MRMDKRENMEGMGWANHFTSQSLVRGCGCGTKGDWEDGAMNFVCFWWILDQDLRPKFHGRTTWKLY